jgi:hypothetical protein
MVKNFNKNGFSKIKKSENKNYSPSQKPKKEKKCSKTSTLNKLTLKPKSENNNSYKKLKQQKKSNNKKKQKTINFTPGPIEPFRNGVFKAKTFNLCSKKSKTTIKNH